VNGVHFLQFLIRGSYRLMFCLAFSNGLDWHSLKYIFKTVHVSLVMGAYTTYLYPFINLRSEWYRLAISCICIQLYISIAHEYSLVDVCCNS
jgi:hypothetical protein